MLAVGFRLDVYSLKFEHKLGYWPVCQLTFIDVWSGRHKAIQATKSHDMQVLTVSQIEYYFFDPIMVSFALINQI